MLNLPHFDQHYGIFYIITTNISIQLSISGNNTIENMLKFENTCTKMKVQVHPKYKSDIQLHFYNKQALK